MVPGIKVLIEDHVLVESSIPREFSIPSNSRFPLAIIHQTNIPILQLDFVWITRDQKSLQWFLELLKRLEEVMDRFSENNPGHTKQPTIYDRKKSRTPAVRIIKDSNKSK